MEWMTLEDTCPTTNVGEEYLGGLGLVVCLEVERSFLLGRPIRMMDGVLCVGDVSRISVAA